MAGHGTVDLLLNFRCAELSFCLSNYDDFLFGLSSPVLASTSGVGMRETDAFVVSLLTIV